ncbi:MAG TPA: DNA methyltransferase [bacterium]|nr:DNA methyltransferase [bacterium]HQO33154.1 DNA methyltransferase [bacterium]HQP98496.1 DNA methyltransferase [bacterium]
MARAFDLMQQTLFECDFDHGGSASDFLDPAFAGNKIIPLHRWVPWIAGFSRDFVRGVLQRYLSGKGTVLDPFAGVGTTLVEALLLGHDAVGFEINPYAALSCKTKLESHKIRIDLFADEIARFQKFYFDATLNGYRPKSKPPPGFRTRSDFYGPEVLRKVLIVIDFIESLQDGPLRELFRIAFGSTMVTYSNYSYEPSLSRRVAVGKAEITDYPVGETVAMKLREMVEDIKWIRREVPANHGKASVINASFMDSHHLLSSRSADLILTSPPYLNNYHYNRNTRPHLYWLGLVQSPAEMKDLENRNFGKYWQTVRELSSVRLDFDLQDSELQQTLDLLRTKGTDRGIYGGNGWANYAATYFNDCHQFLRCAHRVLKKGGTALIVIGNSILQGTMIPTDRHLAKIGELVGLELVGIQIPRATRVGNSIIQSDVRVGKAKKSDSLYESVVELRKP